MQLLEVLLQLIIQAMLHLSLIISKLQVVIYQLMVLLQVWSNQSQMIEYLLMFPLSTLMTALKIGISVSGFPKWVWIGPPPKVLACLNLTPNHQAIILTKYSQLIRTLIIRNFYPSRLRWCPFGISIQKQQSLSGEYSLFLSH